MEYSTHNLISLGVRCFLSNSAILVRRQVCFGLPLFRFPCWFYCSALLITCPSGLLNVWPIHPQSLCLIYWSIGRCPVCLQSSLLLIFLGHQIRKMFLGLLLMNTCNFLSNFLVSLQVSEPFKSTAWTFDPKTLSLVLVVSVVDRHIGLSIANACLAFPIRAWISSSVPPFLCELIHFLNPPRYNRYTIVTFGTYTHQLCLGGIDLQAFLRTLYLQGPCLIPHILYSVRQ